MNLTPNVIRRFWAKVDLAGSGCWNWQAGTFANGYGALSIGRRMEYAHRVSYQIHFDDPTGKFVCHHCDNRPCVNPSHLFLGSAADNHRDMRNKQRDSDPPKHVGSKHPQAVINEEIAREINRLSCDTKLSAKAIARRFGLKSATSVYNIRHGVQWSHAL